MKYIFTIEGMGSYETDDANEILESLESHLELIGEKRIIIDIVDDEE